MLLVNKFAKFSRNFYIKHFGKIVDFLKVKKRKY